MQGSIKFTCRGCNKSKTIKGNAFLTSDGTYSLHVQVPYEEGKRWIHFANDILCTTCTDKVIDILTRSEALQEGTP